MNPIVVYRLENGGLCATGMCSSAAPVSPFFPMGWDGVFAQLAMASPQAQALQPGQSATFDPSQSRWTAEP